MSATYDPKEYWSRRADPNARSGWDEARLRTDIGYIRRHTAGVSRVLELGPGVGRTLAAYAPGTRIVTIDVTDRYQAEFAAAANARGLDVEQYVFRDPFDAMPFADQSFQVGVCSQVLLHQPLELMRHLLKELLRVCARTILISGHYRGNSDLPPPKGDHVFSHDYIGEFSRLGATADDVFADDSRLYANISLRNGADLTRPA